MTGFRGRADDGDPIDPLTPESLRELLRTDPEQVAVVRTDDDATALARRDPGQGWRVELDGPTGRLHGRAPNTDAVFDLLRSWAAEDDWWRDAFSWTAVGPDQAV